MMTPELFRLDKRLALITGSSVGIGFALARGLAQSGATVPWSAADAEPHETCR